MNFKKIILLACLTINVNQSQAMIPAAISTGIIITGALIKCCLRRDRRQLDITTEPIELINPDNRCYSNSLIQCLLQYPKFMSIEKIDKLLKGIEYTDAFDFPLIVDNREVGGNPFAYMLNLFNNIQINRESIEYKINPSQDGTNLTSYPELDLIVCPLKNGEQLSHEIETFAHEGSTYNLTGILCNTNDNSSFQHYYSYVKHDDLWFLCDDEKIINLYDVHEISSFEQLIPVIHNDREITISYYTTGTERETVIVDGVKRELFADDIEHIVNTRNLFETLKFNPNLIENFSRIRTNIEKYTNPTPSMLFYKKETPLNRSQKRRLQRAHTPRKRTFCINDEKTILAIQIITNEEIYSFENLSKINELISDEDAFMLITTPEYRIEGTEFLSEQGLEKLTEIVALKM